MLDFASGAAHRVVACRDLEQYRQVLSVDGGGSAPVIAGERVDLAGFPSGTVACRFEAWQRDSRRSTLKIVDGAAERLCIALDEPLPREASAWLARSCGKRLILASDFYELCSLAANRLVDPRTDSLTIVLTYADPGPLERMLGVLRESSRRGRVAPWGLLVGRDAASLTRNVARAVLGPAIAASYASAPVALVDEHGVSRSEPSPIDGYAPGSRSALQSFAAGRFTPHALAVFRARPWSAVIVRGHGRSYCSCSGFLCGARPPQVPADAPIERCVLGYACAHPSFLRNDPRSLDAAVGVFDTCGAANWSSAVWDTGTPALAFLAVEGAFSSVIASDGITHGRGTAEVLRCLERAGTMGAAAAMLNRARAAENLPLPYVLLGDPDAPCGGKRWPALSAPSILTSFAGERWTARASRCPASPVRVQLPQEVLASGSGAVIFVWSDAGAARIAEAIPFREDGCSELVVGMEPGAEDVVLQLARHTPASLPRNLAQQALLLHARVAPLRPPWSSGVPRLLDAARAVLTTQQVLDRTRAGVVVGRPEDLERLVAAAVEHWRAAHAHCVRQAGSFRAEGLWPFLLWPSYEFSAEPHAAACPVCGREPTVLRSYSSFPGQRRLLWECPECDLIEDRPLSEDGPRIDVRGPLAIRPHERHELELILDHTRGGSDLVGAGCAIVDRSGHGVETDPAYFDLDVACGHVAVTRIQLSCGDVETPHLYRIRVLLFLNGQWYWRSRSLRVGGTADFPGRPRDRHGVDRVAPS